WVTVQFDGGVNSKLPWSFEPEQLTMRVQPGKQYEALYFAKNRGDRAIVRNAVPSGAPARASGHLANTECLCCTAPTPQPGRERACRVRGPAARRALTARPRHSTRKTQTMAQPHSTDAHAHDANVYFVPHGSRWPIFASVGLFILFVGFSGWLNQTSWGKTTFF